MVDSSNGQSADGRIVVAPTVAPPPGARPMAQPLFPQAVGAQLGLTGMPGLRPQQLNSAAAAAAAAAAVAGLPLFQAQAQAQSMGLGRRTSVERAKGNSQTTAGRKQCNCKNSRCLKLYCECFASGRYCSDCNCLQCCNNRENESTRQGAVEAILERNPNAFRPKIQAHEQAAAAAASAANSAGGPGRHLKGCNCKKSSCLKKYCECFQAGIYCSENCKCVDCRNFEDPGGGGGMGGLAIGAGGGGKRVRYSSAPPPPAHQGSVAGIAAGSLAAIRPGLIPPGLTALLQQQQQQQAAATAFAGGVGMALPAGLPAAVVGPLLAQAQAQAQAQAAAQAQAQPSGAGLRTGGGVSATAAGGLQSLPPALSLALAAAAVGAGVGPPPGAPQQALPLIAQGSTPPAAAPLAAPSQGQVQQPALAQQSGRSSLHEVVNGMVKRNVIEELCRLLWLVADDEAQPAKPAAAGTSGREAPGSAGATGLRQGGGGGAGSRQQPAQRPGHSALDGAGGENGRDERVIADGGTATGPEAGPSPASGLATAAGDAGGDGAGPMEHSPGPGPGTGALEAPQQVETADGNLSNGRVPADVQRADGGGNAPSVASAAGKPGAWGTVHADGLSVVGDGLAGGKADHHQLGQQPGPRAEPIRAGLLYGRKERVVLEEFLSILNKIGETAAKKLSQQQQQQQQHQQHHQLMQQPAPSPPLVMAPPSQQHHQPMPQLHSQLSQPPVLQQQQQQQQQQQLVMTSLLTGAHTNPGCQAPMGGHQQQAMHHQQQQHAQAPQGQAALPAPGQAVVPAPGAVSSSTTAGVPQQPQSLLGQTVLAPPALAHPKQLQQPQTLAPPAGPGDVPIIRPPLPASMGTGAAGQQPQPSQLQGAVPVILAPPRGSHGINLTPGPAGPQGLQPQPQLIPPQPNDAHMSLHATHAVFGDQQQQHEQQHQHHHHHPQEAPVQVAALYPTPFLPYATAPLGSGEQPTYGALNSSMPSAQQQQLLVSAGAHPTVPSLPQHFVLLPPMQQLGPDGHPQQDHSMPGLGPPAPPPAVPEGGAGLQSAFGGASSDPVPSHQTQHLPSLVGMKAPPDDSFSLAASAAAAAMAAAANAAGRLPGAGAGLDVDMDSARVMVDGAAATEG